MLLKISHTTRYHYDMPVPYALQRLRLIPRDDATQTVRTWSLSVEGAREQVRFLDQYGNETRLVSVEGEPEKTVIVASGEVETRDTAGVVGPHRGFAPLWLYQAETSLTQAGDRTRKLASEFDAAGGIEMLHDLAGRIRDLVAYLVGSTDASTSAEQALENGSGVCQDHTHVFLSVARQLGYPARYVSGYLMMDGSTEQAASHAWAEAHVDNLGWVSFDASNGISADERYVRIATGRDYRDAMPVSGIRIGAAKEQLAVHITVEQ